VKGLASPATTEPELGDPLDIILATDDAQGWFGVDCRIGIISLAQAGGAGILRDNRGWGNEHASAPTFSLTMIGFVN
jgi:hypothetical protein